MENNYLEIMENIANALRDYLSLTFWENSLQDILTSLLLLLIIFLGLRVFRKIIIVKLTQWTQKTENNLDDKIVEIFHNLSPLFYWIIAIYLGVQKLTLPDIVDTFLAGALVIIVVYEVIKLAQQVIFFLLQNSVKEKDSTALAGIRLIINIVLWSIGLLLVLSNLGIDVSALVASMGIGGIAVALAAQNILGDLFSSFSIYFDKPFQIGDYIVVGADHGVVKKIGLKTTRIQTLQGEELVISNKELTTARVQNFKKLKRRRARFTFGVTYDTDAKILKKIPDIVKKIIETHELTEHERTVFTDFGDSSLNFEVIFYVDSKDYGDYAHLQHQINIEIKEIFDKEKIEMAFPTRTIYTKSA